MKKLLLLVLALVIGTTVFAQSKIQLRSADKAECTKSDMRSLKASFSFSGIDAENVNTKGGEFSWISMPNTVLGGNEGDPQIPVINQLIAVPFGANPTITVTSYSSTDYNLSEMGIGTLIPRQPSMRKDQRPEDVPFVKNEAAYQSTRGFHSEPTARVSVDGTMRGIQIGRMSIEPVSYDPVNNTLRVFNDIEVEVSFNGANTRATEDMLVKTYSPYFDVLYKQLFNERAISDVYSEHPDLWNTPVKMLVIANRMFENCIQDWVTWKKQKGIYVDVNYTDEIGTSTSAIKSFIQTKYAQDAPTFLVIMGDKAQVAPSITSASETSCVSDLYYSSVDGDQFVDMYHSRISAETTSEMTAILNKSLEYEQYTMPDPSYLNNVLLIAGEDDSGWGVKVGRPTIWYASNYYYNTAHGFSNVYEFSNGTYTNCYSYLSSGVGFANYTAHGSQTSWSGPTFNVSNVSSLTNTHKYFFAIGNCCQSGDWGYSTTCFGEALIRAENKGAFAYIGSCPTTVWLNDYYFGVGPTSRADGTMPSMSETGTGIYDAIWMDDVYNTINSILYIGNLAGNAAQALGYTMHEDPLYYWQAYHVLGDGTVMPYRVQPSANSVSHDNQIVAGTNSFRVNADAGSYVSITVNNEIIGVAAVPANATYVDVPFTTTPEAGRIAKIVVTRQQRQPYINNNVPIIGVGEQYDITANVSPTGTGTVEGTGTYYENTNCTLTAVANRGYAFQKWNDNNTENPRTITVTGNATYTAYFTALQQPGITYNTNQEHGTINVNPADAYEGEYVYLTATPAAGYVLDHWDVNTVSKGNVEVLKDGEGKDYFVMPDRAVTINAVFTQKLDPETLTIYGDNTTTNEYVPIYGYWADSKSKCEFIIPKEKISAMNGASISAMKFYLDNSGSNNEFTVTFDVFVKEVEATTLSSWLGQSNATTVYTGNITIPKNGSNVEFDIPFSSNYVYNGGNLLVGFYQTGSTSSYNHTYWTGESQTTNTAYGGYGSSGSAQKFLPKTTFTYEIITTPTISLPASATVLTGFTETLTATTLNVTGTPTISYSSSNTSVATVNGNGTTATVTGVSAGTATITATMTYEGTIYTATCDITVEDPSYCTPGTGNWDNDGIYNVTFGTNPKVNNTVAGIAYGDYSNLVGAVDAGTTCAVDITYKTNYTYGTIIWVDWNQNYSFEGTEAVYAGESGSDTPTTLNATFDVPATTPAGDYRMRIIGADMALDSYTGSLTAAANADPCGSYNYSTCHDYTLRVISGAYTITCATTTGGTISADKIKADENDVVTITATPETDYMLTALTYTPEGGTAQSIDITDMPYTFTMPAANVTVNATFTLSSCPRPTNLTVSNLTAHGANVSWTSDASEFTVKYSTATVTGTTLDPVFEDSFENGLDSWTTYANGYVATNTSNTYNITDWHQQDMTSNSPYGHTGTYVAMSRSYDGTDRSVDNWLITPQILLGDVVQFYVAGDEGWPEYYEVYVSTETNAVSDFHLVEAPALATGSWEIRSIDISTYAGQTGYVAIRHTDTGKDYLFVDDFGVYNTINTYSYGGWTTVSPNPTTNSCQLTGLSAETLYEVQVQANCGGTDGSSAWSRALFTTPDNCGAPQELASSNITATTATLSWADDKDSYNLQYRKVYFYEGFEGETLPTGWTTIDANSDGLTWGVGHATTHSGHNGAYNVSYVYSSDGSVSTTPDDYLISPQLDLQGTLRVWLSGNNATAYAEHFAILLSTSGNSVSDFTTTLVAETTTSNSYVEYTADLSSYTGKGYIAIHHFNCTDQRELYVDDFGIYGSENWVTLSPNPTTETATLTGLTPNTSYEWQVQGVNCDGLGGTTEWSAAATFTTLNTVTQEIALSAGWNWLSFNVDITMADLKAALAAAAPGTQIVIKSKDNKQATYNPTANIWVGQLNTLDLTQMYRVKVTAACQAELVGLPIDLASTSITIKKGANWICFPGNATMTLQNAFAGFAANGDKVKSKDNKQATYNAANNLWIGQLKNLEPGNGYIFTSTQDADRSLVFPSAK